MADAYQSGCQTQWPRLDGCRGETVLHGSRFVSIAHAEVEPFACAVYHRHFPDSVCFGGVQNVTRNSVLERCGVLPVVVTGGFPCQPHSCAGKRLASADDRDLWGECGRILGDLRPRYALFENVAGLLTSESGGFFNRVLSDLAALRYACVWQVVPASAVGAPHRRERVWIICRDELGNTEHAGLDAAEIAGSNHQGSDCHQTGTRTGGELARPSQQYVADSHQPRPQGRDSQELRECGRQRAAGASDSPLLWPALSGHWPSRPGEAQHGWEPPRVVGDTGYGSTRPRSEPVQPQQSTVAISGTRQEMDDSEGGKRHDVRRQWSQGDVEGNGTRTRTGQAESPLGHVSDGLPAAVGGAGEEVSDGQNQKTKEASAGNGEWPTPTVNDCTGSQYAYGGGNKDKPFLKLPGAVQRHKGGTGTSWPEVHNRVAQLKGAGNAIVPEVAAIFLNAIRRQLA